MITLKTILFITTMSRIANIRSLATMAFKIPEKMKAVGMYKCLPISDPDSLQDLEIPVPALDKSDVLIEVKAVSVNPIDTKVRAGTRDPQGIEKKARILGWDGSGVVVAKGDNVKFYKPGDQVIFTGDFRRNGSNAQYVALDEIVVGPKPKSLDFEQAAAMPLTSVTAYECIYDRLLLSEKDKGKTILIINSAGGVGSIATQLAKNLGLKVIGTASRPETQAFTRRFGADLVLNHTQDLIPQLKAHGHENVDYILVNYDPYPYWDVMTTVIKPQGRICLIVDSSGLVDLKALKEKSITLVWEMMMTRIKYDTEDKFRHHEILKEVSKLIDDGKLQCTMTKTMSPINAANLREAHRFMEEKTMIGKIVLHGF